MALILNSLYDVLKFQIFMASIRATPCEYLSVEGVVYFAALGILRGCFMAIVGLTHLNLPANGGCLIWGRYAAFFSNKFRCKNADGYSSPLLNGS